MLIRWWWNGFIIYLYTNLQVAWPFIFVLAIFISWVWQCLVTECDRSIQVTGFFLRIRILRLEFQILLLALNLAFIVEVDDHSIRIFWREGKDLGFEGKRISFSGLYLFIIHPRAHIDDVMGSRANLVIEWVLRIVNAPCNRCAISNTCLPLVITWWVDLLLSKWVQPLNLRFRHIEETSCSTLCFILWMRFCLLFVVVSWLWVLLLEPWFLSIKVDGPYEVLVTYLDLLHAQHLFQRV